MAAAIRIVVIAPDHDALFRSHVSLLGTAIKAVLESRSVEDAIQAASARS